MVRVHTGGITSVQTCFLGSLAAVRCLADASDVHVVINLFAADMQRIRGQPEEGWEKFLADKAIEHVSIDLEDPRSARPGADDFCEEMADVFFATWLRMCTQITQFLQARSAGLATGLLFHCFGGINRSSAALVAWLIFNYYMTADAAIAELLRARPSLSPLALQDFEFKTAKEVKRTLAGKLSVSRHVVRLLQKHELVPDDKMLDGEAAFLQLVLLPFKGVEPRAAERGHVERAQLLLEARATVNKIDSDCESPLGCCPSRPWKPCARVTREAGACTERSGTHETPLLLAAREAHVHVVTQLVNASASVNARDSEGCTALHLAAQHGALDLVRLLLIARAYPEACDLKGDTVTHI
eukprot:s730_g24.t1